MVAPLIYADFNNLADSNRLRLTCDGTIADFQQQGLEPQTGLPLTFYMDDADDEGRSDRLLVEGTVEYYNESEKCWVAAVDWATLRHESDRPSDANRASNGPVEAAPTTPGSAPTPAAPRARPSGD